MKSTARETNHSFVETITVSSKTYVIRFVFDASGEGFTVYIVNDRQIPPCIMKRIDQDNWRIVDTAPEQIAPIELKLEELILKNT